MLLGFGIANVGAWAVGGLMGMVRTSLTALALLTHGFQGLRGVAGTWKRKVENSSSGWQPRSGYYRIATGQSETQPEREGATCV